MANNIVNKRLLKEYKSLQVNPPPFIIAKPKDNNLLECHYIITGPPDSPYEGGQYHGCLYFPSEYPFKPPSIKMFTPNGRFQVNFRLCLTMSDYHPSSWNPAWSVSTILTGLLSFMLEDTVTTGSISTSTMEKQSLSKSSRRWNSQNRQFRDIFPELVMSENVRMERPPTATAVPSQNNNLPFFTSRSTFIYFIIGLILYVFISKLFTRFE